MSEQLHYYCLSFYESQLRGGAHAQVICGFPDSRVTQKRIAGAREVGQVGPDAVLLACSYLGLMTPKEFKEIE